MLKCKCFWIPTVFVFWSRHTFACTTVYRLTKARSVLMKEEEVRKSGGVKEAEVRRRDIFDFTAGCLERLTSARDLHLLSHFAWKFRSKQCHCGISLVHNQTRNTHTHQKKSNKKNSSHSHSRPLPSSSSLLPEAQRYFYLP